MGFLLPLLCRKWIYILKEVTLFRCVSTEDGQVQSRGVQLLALVDMCNSHARMLGTRVPVQSTKAHSSTRIVPRAHGLSRQARASCRHFVREVA